MKSPRIPLIHLLSLGLLVSAGCGDRNKSAGTEQDGGTLSGQTDEFHDLHQAIGAFQRNDFDAAEASVRAHLLQHPSDAMAIELSGDISAGRGDSASAIDRYRAAIDLSKSPTELLHEKLGMQLIAVGRAFDSISVLDERIERFPNSVQARSDLVGLSALLGWAEHGVSSLRWLAQRGQVDGETLQVLANPRRVEPDQEFCATLLQRCPQDLRPELSLARLDAQQMDWPEATRRLEAVVQRHQDFVPAYTMFGLALAQQGQWDQIPGWQRAAPADAVSSPEYWLVAGQWSQHNGQHAEAARAFWEAVRLDTTGDVRGLSDLSLSLRQIGRTQEAEIVDDYLVRQVALRDALKTHLERAARSQQAAIRVADAMTQLGRLWEAEGWARVSLSLPEDPLPDIRQQYMTIRGRISTTSPWQLPDSTLAGQISLSDLPLVDWAHSRSTRLASPAAKNGKLFFQDEARERGWNHTCDMGAANADQGLWIHETTAGGVAVIDFDLDGWPDLAASMLDGTALASDSAPNQLYRNLGGKFRRCTQQANYLDTGFGQGIAVGDFNDDGFPDIFDPNIGRNRLYRNNGDGTFQEVSLPSGLAGQFWTTSAALADLDGDGFADLYEVAYCSGTAPFEQPCRNRRGIIATCAPLTFEAEADRVWRGRGDGTFEDVTSQWMQSPSLGRGLGVLVGAFDEREGLDVYVSNDMTVNNFWSAIHESRALSIDRSGIRARRWTERSIDITSIHGHGCGRP